MRLRDPKTRCIKRKIPKCKDILRTYDKVQNAYADILAEDNDVVEIFCNLPLEDKSVGDFVSDFVCTKSDGTTMVRECVLRTNLLRPRTVKLLDFSQRYWANRGVSDWKVIINEEE